MLESRPEDALGSLVETVETEETEETVQTTETVETEKKSLSNSLSDNLKARDASASKKDLWGRGYALSYDSCCFKGRVSQILVILSQVPIYMYFGKVKRDIRT